MTARNVLMSLAWRLLAGVILAAALIGVAALFSLRISWPVPLAAGLALGAVLWLLDIGVDHDEPLHHPELDLEADYALPHAQDVRVRRLEDTIYGSQPSRRMTTRSLGQILGEIADERTLDPAAPALSRDLAQFIDRSRAPAGPDGTAATVAPVNRRTLHRYLHELAAREERDR